MNKQDNFDYKEMIKKICKNGKRLKFPKWQIKFFSEYFKYITKEK